jgi:hypothetical protein
MNPQCAKGVPAGFAHPVVCVLGPNETGVHGRWSHADRCEVEEGPVRPADRGEASAERPVQRQQTPMSTRSHRVGQTRRGGWWPASSPANYRKPAPEGYYCRQQHWQRAMSSSRRVAVVATLVAVVVSLAPPGVACADNSNNNTNNNDVTDVGNPSVGSARSNANTNWPPADLSWPPNDMMNSGRQNATPIVMPRAPT